MTGKSIAMTPTLTPWHLSHELSQGFSVAHEVAPGSNAIRPVCICEYDDRDDPRSAYPTCDEAKANAEFIVLAVNSHAALVEALNSCVSFIEASGGQNIYLPNSLEKARAALKLAGQP